VNRATRISAQLAFTANRMSRRAIGAISITLFLAAFIFWPPLGDAIAPGKRAPELAGETWLNSKPLTLAALKGRVVLVEFWTYG
jgi:hypothetical protein